MTTVQGASLNLGDTIRLAGKPRTITRLVKHDAQLGSKYPARMAYWPSGRVVVFDCDSWPLVSRSGT